MRLSIKKCISLFFVFTLAVISNYEDSYAGRRSSGKRFGQGFASAMAPVLANATNQFGNRMDQSIKLMDTVLNRNLNQFDGIMSDLVDQSGAMLSENINLLDNSMNARLRQFDKSNKENLQYLDQISDDAVSQLNDALSVNIDKFNEGLRHNISFLDSGAQRFSTLFGFNLIRFLLVGALIAIIFYQVYIHVKDVELSDLKNIGQKFKSKSIQNKVVAIGFRISVLTGVYFILNFIFLSGPKQEIEQISVDHEVGFDNALRTFNFKDMALHAAILKNLNSGSMEYIALEKKSDLFREVFALPILKNNIEYVGMLRNQLDELIVMTPNDPDNFAIAAYLNWNIRQNKIDEYVTACLAAESIKLGSESKDGTVYPNHFIALAKNYLQSYLTSPIEAKDVPSIRSGILKNNSRIQNWYSNAQLDSIMDNSPESGEFDVLNIQMNYAMKFNRYLDSLNTTIYANYFNMIKNHVEIFRIRNNNGSSAEMSKFVDKRNIHAREIYKAFRKFEEALPEVLKFKESANGFATLKINDAILIRAKFYLANSIHTNSADFEQKIPGTYKSQLEYLSENMSAFNENNYQPLRINVLKEVKNHLSGMAREILVAEELNRFINYDDQLYAFEKSFLEYTQEKESNSKVKKLYEVAENASVLNLYHIDNITMKTIPLHSFILNPSRINEFKNVSGKTRGESTNEIIGNRDNFNELLSLAF